MARSAIEEDDVAHAFEGSEDVFVSVIAGDHASVVEQANTGTAGNGPSFGGLRDPSWFRRTPRAPTPKLAA